MMRLIGVTGGVGAGKSEVLHYLETGYDAYVLRSDELSHTLMEPGTPCYRQVVALFGEDIVAPDGTLDRPAIATRMYGDETLRQGMNGIMHPAVRQAVMADIERQRQAGRRFFFLEAALLIETHYDEVCDELWYIYADPAVRAARLRASRGYSDEKIQQMMVRQLPDETFRRYCQVVIDNSGNFDETKKQIDARMNEYHEVM